jgi:hypothetical protein
MELNGKLFFYGEYEKKANLHFNISIHLYSTGSLGCWSHVDPITSRLRGLGDRGSLPTGQYNLKDAVYQDAGIYKCVGQSSNGKKKLEVIHTVSVGVRGECWM